ncbi:MAG: hypothetical protein P1S60_13735 [Anaerolineae bacterium]|nr:hypothetical protein [Anaerolineae bacterium]
MHDKAIHKIAKLLFNTEKQAKIGAEVLQAVMAARSARWTEIARKMAGQKTERTNDCKDLWTR